MSDVELLRPAAALMRERAESAHGMPWVPQPSGGVLMNNVWYADVADHADAEHLASWNPAVALAVAGLLDYSADWIGDLTPHAEIERDKRAGHAINVARTYLGGAS